MAKYRKKPITIEARQLAISEVVLTAHGRVRAEPGDWVLVDPATGDSWPIKPDIFEATYEKVIRIANPIKKETGSPCLCGYDPVSGYRRDIFCPKHDGKRENDGEPN